MIVASPEPEASQSALRFATCDVRLGSKADICTAIGDVRFTPDSDRESGPPQTLMSALPSKADMCVALAHVCFGPKADMAVSLDHLVHAREILERRATEVERLAKRLLKHRRIS